MKTRPSTRSRRIIVSFIPCITQLLHNLKDTELKSEVRRFLNKISSRVSVLEILKMGKDLLKARAKLADSLKEISELVAKVNPLRLTRSVIQESSCGIADFETLSSSLPDEEPDAPSTKAMKVSKRYKQLVFHPRTLNLKSPPCNKSCCVKKHRRNPINKKCTSVAMEKIVDNNTVKNQNYLFVQHIGASATGFRCLVAFCFQPEISNEDDFVEHLKKKHGKVVWNSYCSACSSVIGNIRVSRNIVKEFEHLQNSHYDRSCLKDPELVGEQENNSGVLELQSLLEKNTGNPDDDDAFNDKLNLVPESPTQELRPWLQDDVIKRKIAFDEMDTVDCFVALYKCMDASCSFFSASQEHFADHLNIHRAIDGRAGHEHCAYCTFKTTGDVTLIDHIKSIHSCDRFQCSFCFYRSSTSENVFAHTMFYHQVEPVAVECESLGEIDVRQQLKSLRENHNEENVIPLLLCPICKPHSKRLRATHAGIPKLSYHFFEDFKEHLKVTHKNYENFQCIVCNETVERNLIFDHLEKCHQIGLYQCVYCNHGSNTVIKARMHLADKHPSEYPFVCLRKRCYEAGAEFSGKFTLKSSKGTINGEVLQAADAVEIFQDMS